jgi:hypothetical protein
MNLKYKSTLPGASRFKRSLIATAFAGSALAFYFIALPTWTGGRESTAA